MGKELKGITAKEARELADSSDFTLRHIYKTVRERATENGVSIEWCTYEASQSAMEKVIAQLEQDGFKVKVDDECQSLTITW